MFSVLGWWFMGRRLCHLLLKKSLLPERGKRGAKSISSISSNKYKHGRSDRLMWRSVRAKRLWGRANDAKKTMRTRIGRLNLRRPFEVLGDVALVADS